MKARELRELTRDELAAKGKELADQLFKLRFQHALGQLDNAMKLKNIKKDIARIQTLLNEKSEKTE